MCVQNKFALLFLFVFHRHTYCMKKHEHDKMEMLHNGQRDIPEAEPPIEVLVDRFAEILVEAYFHEKRNEQ